MLLQWDLSDYDNLYRRIMYLTKYSKSQKTLFIFKFQRTITERASFFYCAQYIRFHIKVTKHAYVAPTLCKFYGFRDYSRAKSDVTVDL